MAIPGGGCCNGFIDVDGVSSLIYTVLCFSCVPVGLGSSKHEQ